VTATQIQGRYAIRLCVLNHTTEDEDVAFAIDRVAEADIDELEDGGVPARGHRSPGRRACRDARPRRVHDRGSPARPWL
jgi:hypothetical protein